MVTGFKPNSGYRAQVTNPNISDEDNESKEVKPAEGEEKKEGDETTEENAEKPKKEWIINAWVKKQVAEKLPIIKPIPGFCKYFCLGNPSLELHI